MLLLRFTNDGVLSGWIWRRAVERGKVTMFARLWRWMLLGPQRAADGAAGAREDARPGPDVATIAHPTTKHDELFFEQLARELTPVPPVASEDEPLITALVLEVVAYVAKKKVEPPVMPALVPRVLAIVGEPEVDLARLTHLIEQDLAISAKVLSVANSPLFARGAAVETVRQAIAHLGTEQVAQLAIGLACGSSFEADSTQRSPFEARWTLLFRHAMTCGFTASHLASKRGRAAQESAFLAGLFHDVGKAVALRAIEALSMSGRLAPLRDELVDEALHRIHAYPGDEFYDKWTLPEALMELCARHHQLDDVDEGDETFHLVSLASSFDALLSGNGSERRDALHEARTSADRLGLSEDALQAAYKQTRAFGERTTRMFLR